MVYWHESPTVAHIGNIAIFTNNEYNNGTWSTSLNWSIIFATLTVSMFQEGCFSLCKTSFDGFFRILREVLISHNQLMKLISEEISTWGPSMTIINSKERASRPKVNLFELGLNDVQDDRHSIFIVIPYHTLVCIGCIRHYYAILLGCILGWVVILLEPLYLLVFHLNVFLSLLDSHLHSSILNNIIWSQVLLSFLLKSFGL